MPHCRTEMSVPCFAEQLVPLKEGKSLSEGGRHFEELQWYVTDSLKVVILYTSVGEGGGHFRQLFCGK